eukprot:scaffold79686_cov35-Cyclotella_meneghiniana.AAC.1
MAVITILRTLLCSMLHFTNSFLLPPTRRAFFHSSTKANYGYPHKSRALYLNRILFDASEIDGMNSHINNADENDDSIESKEWMATVTLPKSDYRTIHMAKILGLQNGDAVRAGSVITCDEVQDDANYNSDNDGSTVSNNNHQTNHHLQGLLTDQAIVQWIPEGKIKKAEPTKNGEPPGSVRLYIPPPPQTTFQTQDNDNYSKPPISLLLALPRPLQLQRILPMISQLGVDTIILTHAAKVPKDYFGSHLFRKPELIRDLLIEGLTLSGNDLRLPRVVVSKRPVGELFEELQVRFPMEDWVRVIAHPERKSVNKNGNDGDEVEVVVEDVVRMTDVDFPMEKNGKRRKLLVAVGPEGGWEEPNELDLFEKHGFQK